MRFMCDTPKCSWRKRAGRVDRGARER